MIDILLLLLRVLTFEKLLFTLLFPRKSHETRLGENKSKLVQFFEIHDPARISEAEKLLLVIP
jgi:hypothetical protein